MITISLCMIVKNEEEILHRCLDSVKDIVDEIIIVDTGSKDGTKEVAKNYTDKVFDFEWINDFAAARNYAYSKATMEYILCMDADDLLMEEDREKLLLLKETLPQNVDYVNMQINLVVDENGKATHKMMSNRLVKRSCNFKWVGAVHECLERWGNSHISDVAITHKKIHQNTDRNINIYEERLRRNEDFSPRDLYYYANELNDHRRYKEALEYYLKFLDTRLGWFEDNIAACGKICDIKIQLNDFDGALQYNLQSLKYDAPRAEFCCRMGYIFLIKKMYKQAVFWYKLATELEKQSEIMGFVNKACWTWLPHIQLCVCYDCLGLHQKAYEHNEAARFFLPNDQRVLYNKEYLENILKNKE